MNEYVLITYLQLNGERFKYLQFTEVKYVMYNALNFGSVNEYLRVNEPKEVLRKGTGCSRKMRDFVFNPPSPNNMFVGAEQLQELIRYATVGEHVLSYETCRLPYYTFAYVHLCTNRYTVIQR